MKFPHSFMIFLTINSVGAKEHSNRESQSFNATLLANIINGTPPFFPRDFYVRIQLAIRGFCGGTIIDRSWVVTSAQCVYDREPFQLEVEVGDFTIVNGEKTTHNVSKVFLAPEFKTGRIPVHDIALLKLREPVKETHRILALCPDEKKIGTQVGSCGMGTTSRTNLSGFPNKLQEIVLFVSKFKYTSLFDFALCTEDIICTTKVLDANICYMDEGGPLYAFPCGSIDPECLLGVASYSTSTTHPLIEACNADNYFTSVPYHYDWIEGTLEQE